MRRQTGFNLIELLVVVFIIGVLSSVAYSSYAGYTEQARRSSAAAYLLQMAQAQEKHYLEENTYAASTSALDLPGSSSTSDYSFTVEKSDSQPYKLTATTKSSGAQAGDTACATMWLNSMNQRGPKACWQ